MNSKVGMSRTRCCPGSLWASALFLFFMGAPLAAEELWTPKHLAKLRSIVSAKVSPDGKSLAYLLAIVTVMAM